MPGQAILLTTLLLPLFLGLVFRVNTSHLFFSIMAGELLARLFGHDVQSKLPNNQLPYGELSIFLATMFLTALFLKGTLHKHKIVLHVVPLLFTGIILSAFVLPIMPATIQDSIHTSIAGSYILTYNKYIVGGVVVLQLILLWLLNRPHEKHEHGHH